MPGKTGFDLLAELEKSPKVIFTTAYDEFALKAFEVNALDYLLKPIEGRMVSIPSRLSETVPHFKGIFDAAAIGQYFGGIDTIHNPNNSDGFISTHSAFQVDKLHFQWRKINNLYQPWMSADKSTWYPIYNLHIHNKHMTRWLSDSPSMKAHLFNITIV
jgi:CheY-like chemotaxis protein